MWAPLLIMSIDPRTTANELTQIGRCIMISNKNYKEDIDYNK